MSRKGNCYYNAPIESIWGTMKNELVFHRHYRTREQAIREITEYIEIFYNRQRRQKRPGYLSPVIYEQQFYERSDLTLCSTWDRITFNHHVGKVLSLGFS